MDRRNRLRAALMRYLAGLVAAGAILCPLGATAGYIDPGNPPPRVADPEPSDIRYQTRGSRIVHRGDETLEAQWTINREMSRACRRGLFKQRADRRYVALLGPDVYGAAIGGHRSLVDKASLAEESVLYLFAGQGTTGCRVYHRQDE